jgi:hypothetical protein
MNETIKGTINKWSEPKTGVSGTGKSWAKISCEIDGIWHSIWAEEVSLKAGTFQQEFATIVTSIPKGSHVQFESRINEKDGRKSGSIIKGTMKILAEAPAPSKDITASEIIKAKTGQQSDTEEIKGKIRTHVACAFISAGTPLHTGTVKEIEQWVEFILIGKLEEKKPLPEQEVEIVVQEGEEEIEY